MGGGWCSSIDDCIERSRQKSTKTSPSLGSSKDWKEHVVCDAESQYTPKEDSSEFPNESSAKGSLPCHYDGGEHGLISYNPIENPLAYNWNKVYIPYCDGASFSGNVIEPVSGNKTKGQVYFRGQAILDAGNFVSFYYYFDVLFLISLGLIT